MTIQISKQHARAIWIQAQRLNEEHPFGEDIDATARAIKHLGYVQIDTINVIERCHHHILFNRIPNYKRSDLEHAQSTSKTVFEYWTHALSYISSKDFRYFIPMMKQQRKNPSNWTKKVARSDINAILKRIRENGPLAISDIKDDKLVEKTHAWGSRKPSKDALQAAFYNGELVISKREGMLKTYELTDRHFGFHGVQKPATELQVLQYVLSRALRAQGLISLNSICHLDAKAKPGILKLIEQMVRTKKLVPVKIEGVEKVDHWAAPETFDTEIKPANLIHILSPFDPLIIIRKRTQAIFDYEHLFEAYVPAAKRKLGYFTLPVLVGDEIVAAIDLKTDRKAKKMRVQSWHWVGHGNAKDHKALIEEELSRFERFQLANST